MSFFLGVMHTMNNQDVIIGHLREQLELLTTQLAAAHARVTMLERQSSIAHVVLRHERLTKQEQAVLLHFLECFNDKEIARRTGRKLQTVRNQITSIMHKLGARSRGELVARAVLPQASDVMHRHS